MYNRHSKHDTSIKKALYRTELCHSIIELCECPYGEKCQYAHSLEELRPIPDNMRHIAVRSRPQSSQMCKNFTSGNGVCYFGARCCFSHQTEGISLNESDYLQLPKMILKFREGYKKPSTIENDDDGLFDLPLAELPTLDDLPNHLFTYEMEYLDKPQKLFDFDFSEVHDSGNAHNSSYNQQVYHNNNNNNTQPFATSQSMTTRPLHYIPQINEMHAGDRELGVPFNAQSNNSTQYHGFSHENHTRNSHHYETTQSPPLHLLPSHVMDEAIPGKRGSFVQKHTYANGIHNTQTTKQSSFQQMSSVSNSHNDVRSFSKQQVAVNNPEHLTIKHGDTYNSGNPYRSQHNAQIHNQQHNGYSMRHEREKVFNRGNENYYSIQRGAAMNSNINSIGNIQKAAPYSSGFQQTGHPFGHQVQSRTHLH